MFILFFIYFLLVLLYYRVEVIILNIGENIKLFRKKNKLTQKQLSELIGVSTITIQNYENNRRKPSIDTLQNISTALHVPLNDLLSSFIDENTEIIKDIIDYIYPNNHWIFPIPFSCVPGLEEILKKYFGFDIPTDPDKIDENILTKMLWTIIITDLNKFIELFLVYNKLILSFKESNLKTLDTSLKYFNISIEQLISNLTEANKLNSSNIVKCENNKQIEYSIYKQEKVSELTALNNFQNILDYIQLKSKYESVNHINYDLVNKKILFEKTIAYLEKELLIVLIEKGILVNKSSLNKNHKKPLK